MKCSCGCGLPIDHVLGSDKCFRERVWARPRKKSGSNDKWIVDDHTITEFTLFSQWLYYRHPCGNWSRPKSQENIDSAKSEKK